MSFTLCIFAESLILLVPILEANLSKHKATRTKTALYEAMLSRKGGGSSSRSAVDWVKKSKDGRAAISAEMEEILDLGLMTLAGRVAAGPAIPSEQGDLFALGRPKLFTDLRISTDEGYVTDRVESKKISLRQWEEQPKKRGARAEKGKTKDEILEEYFRKMKKEGIDPETTLGEYLGI